MPMTTRKPAAAMNNSPLTPTAFALIRVTNGPAIAPRLPPAASSPKKRVACAAENVSTISVQKTDTMNRFATLNQT